MVVNLGHTHRQSSIGIVVASEIHIKFALLLSGNLKALLCKREIILVLRHLVPVNYISHIFPVGMLFKLFEKILSVGYGHIYRVERTASFNAHSAEMLNVKLHTYQIEKTFGNREKTVPQLLVFRRKIG